MNMNVRKYIPLIIIFSILILFCVPISLNNNWGADTWFTLSHVKSTEGIDFIRASHALEGVGGAGGRFFPLQFLYYDTVDYLFNLDPNGSADALYFFNLLFIISVIILLFIAVYILTKSKDIIYYLFVPVILLNGSSAEVLYLLSFTEPLLLVLLSLSLVFFLLYISNKSESKLYFCITALFFVLSVLEKETAAIFIFSIFISSLAISLLFKSRIDTTLRARQHKITWLTLGIVSLFLLVYLFSAKLTAFSETSFASGISISNIPKGILAYLSTHWFIALIFLVLTSSIILRTKYYIKTKEIISRNDFLLCVLSVSAALFLIGLSLVQRYSGRYVLPIYVLLIPASCLAIDVIRSYWNNFRPFLQKEKIGAVIRLACLALILLIPLYLYSQDMIRHYNTAIQYKTNAELFTQFRNMADANIEDNAILYLYRADRGDHDAYYMITSYFIGILQNKTIDIRSVEPVKNIAQFKLDNTIPKSTEHHKCLADMRKFTAYTKFEPDDGYMNNSWIIGFPGTYGRTPDVGEFNIDEYENFKAIKEVTLLRVTVTGVASDILHQKGISLFTKKPAGYWAIRYNE